MITHKKIFLLSTALSLPIFLSCQEKEQETVGRESVKQKTKSQREVTAAEEFNTKTIREVKELAPDAEENDSPFAKILSNKNLKVMIEKKIQQELSKSQKLLNLSPEQSKKFKAYFARNGFSSKGYDAFLKDVLDANQYELYQENEAKEEERTREASALRELADIQTVLELSDTQKDSVLNLLFNNPIGGANANQSLAGQAIDGQAVLRLGEDLDMKTAVDKAVEEQEKYNTELINLLEPVLDEQQKEDYTKHLDNNVQSLKAVEALMGTGNSYIQSIQLE